MSERFDRRTVGLAAFVILVAGCSGSTPTRPGGGGQGGGAATSGLGGTNGLAGANGLAGTSGLAGVPGAAGIPGVGGMMSGGNAGAGGKAAQGGGGQTGGLAGSSGSAGVNGAGGGFQRPPGALTFDVSTTTNPVAPGSRLLFNITVGNASTVAVDGVTIVWLLPTGLQFNYINDAQPNNSGCGACAANGQATWTLGTLAAGSSRTISVNTQVLQTVGDGDAIATSFKLTATAMNPLTFAKTINVFGKPSAQLAAGTPTSPLQPGQRAMLEIDAGQLGTAALTGAALRTTLPPGLSVGSIGGGGTQTAPGIVDWPIGALGVGAAIHRTIDLIVDSDVPAGAILKTTTVLTYDGGADVDATCEHAVTVVGAPPSLLLNIATSGTPGVPGQDVHYTLTITNRETRAIENVTLMMRVPAGLQFNYINNSEPNNSGCGACVEGGEATWALGSMPSKSSRTIDLDASIVASQVGNGNVIRSPFLLIGETAPEVVAIKTIQVHDNPGAQFVIGSSGSPVIPGQALTYSVDVGQIGATPLPNGRVHLWLPPEMVVATVSDGGTQPTPSEIVWELGTIAVGTDLHRSVAIAISAAAVPGALLAIRGELTYDGGGEVDAVMTDALPVIELAQSLTLTIGANPIPAVPGARTLYTATVTNTAARAVDGVSLLLRVPNGLQFNYINDADPNSSGCGACTWGGEASWAIGSMAPGAKQIITINPQIVSTVVQGTLLPTPFTLNATGLMAPIRQTLVVPTH